MESLETVQMDSTKQITTLSTAAVLLLTIFLEKLVLIPLWKNAVILSFAGFLASVIAGMAARTFPQISRSSRLLMEGAFAAGLLALGAFAIRNLS